jgi:hypothetical protein
MTIAGGFPCQGGVLLCADTQHEGGATKTCSAKVRLSNCRTGKVAYAYAGHTPFAISAIQKCTREIKKVLNPEDIVPKLEDVIDAEYKRTVYAHPDRNSDWQIQDSLLFAIWNKGSQSWLYSAHETSLQNVLTFECFGIGMDVANYLIKPTYNDYLSEADAVYMATFVLSPSMQVCSWLRRPSTYARGAQRRNT